MVTGKFGLMVRVMGTSIPQTLTSQAKSICLEIARINPASLTARSAISAVSNNKHLEFIQDMAFQITDHQNALSELKSDKEKTSESSDLKKFRFSESLDAWILDLDVKIKKLNP